MDASTLVFGIIFVIVIFGPFTYLIVIGKNQFKKIRVALEKLADDAQLKIDEEEIWSDKALGINHDQKKLLYINHQRDNIGNIIDLRKINFVKVDESEGSIELVLKTSSRVINKISLKIHTQGIDDPIEIRGHRISAYKWKDIIQQVLKDKPAPLALSA